MKFVLDRYPGRGRELLGIMGWGNCRTSYGAKLIEITAITTCAYCDLDFCDDFFYWQAMVADHVISVSLCGKMGISAKMLPRLLKCDAGVYSMQRVVYRYSLNGRTCATLPEFYGLRDEVFGERKRFIGAKKLDELAYFNMITG